MTKMCFQVKKKSVQFAENLTEEQEYHVDYHVGNTTGKSMSISNTGVPFYSEQPYVCLFVAGCRAEIITIIGPILDDMLKEKFLKS